MTNGGFTALSGDEMLRSANADLIAYGKPFISNPKLVEKFKSGEALTPWDSKTFYTQGEEGYLDY